jgi:HPt (histidine-containing phosphotransfer) domain-containing protein
MDPIRSAFENDPDMIDIVREFAAAFPERMAALETCLAEGDLHKLQSLAHQLKGAGGGYGFPQITEAAGSLEKVVKEGAELSVIKEQLEILCEILRAVVVPEAD